jgi:hypothetical protein
MELDDLKAQWNEIDRKLDASIRLNTRVVRESLLGKAESALRRLSFFVTAEMIINVPLLYIFGSFMADHVTEPRFLLPALLLHLFVIAQLGSAIHQLVAVKRIDYGEPIVSIQKTMARLRVQRIRIWKWTLIVAPLLWPPLFIVAVHGLTGIDPYVVLGRWIAVNFAFGIAFVALMVWVSKRFGTRISGWPWMRRLMDDIAGRSLSKATRFLDDVAKFEAE